MTITQFAAIMAGCALTLAALVWVTMESARHDPSRAYTAIKRCVDALFDVLALQINRLFATRVMRRLFG